MKKLYTVFELTNKGKLRDMGWNRYNTEEECIENDLKGINCGSWVVLPIYELN